MTDQKDSFGLNQVRVIKEKFAQIRQELLACHMSEEVFKEIDALEDLVLDPLVDQGRQISAQLSLYPLRQPLLSPSINEAIRILEEDGLKVIQGAMSSIILGSENALWRSLRRAFTAASVLGDVVMQITVSNACPGLNG